MSSTFDTGYLFLDILLYLILFIKLLTIFLVLFKKLIIKSNILSKEKILTLQEFLHSLFMILMPLLLIILFNPITDKYLIINHHIKLFLFVFGILEIIDRFKIPHKIINNLN